MKSTNGSSHDINNKKPLLPSLPLVSYSTIPLKELFVPPELFDKKTYIHPISPIDTIMPIIASQSKNKGRYVIVDGCKRFKYMLLAKNQKKCACGVFENVLDPKSVGILRIFLNHTRVLSIREKICFFKWLKKNCEGNDFDALCNLLGFDIALRLELEPLLSCPDNVLDAVNDGRIAVRLAPDLCLLGAQDQAAFLDIFRGLDLSLQTQREFLEWLPEIAYARKTSVKRLLASAEIQKIINDKILNNPQKIEAIRELLHSWKFPLYDEALKKWKKLAAATSRSALENEPSSQVSFIPSPAFEMNKLEIRITINRAPAAKEIFQKLSAIPQSTWSQLIYPINNFSI